MICIVQIVDMPQTARTSHRLPNCGYLLRWFRLSTQAASVVTSRERPGASAPVVFHSTPAPSEVVGSHNTNTSVGRPQQVCRTPPQCLWKNVSVGPPFYTFLFCNQLGLGLGFSAQGYCIKIGGFRKEGSTPHAYCWWRVCLFSLALDYLSVSVNVVLQYSALLHAISYYWSSCSFANHCPNSNLTAGSRNRDSDDHDAARYILTRLSNCILK